MLRRGEGPEHADLDKCFREKGVRITISRH